MATVRARRVIKTPSVLALAMTPLKRVLRTISFMVAADQTILMADLATIPFTATLIQTQSLRPLSPSPQQTLHQLATATPSKRRILLAAF